MKKEYIGYLVVLWSSSITLCLFLKWYLWIVLVIYTITAILYTKKMVLKGDL